MISVFRRSNNGQSNMHLFLNCHAIVYVEGGNTSFSIADIRAGNFNATSVDSSYWQILFKNYYPRRQFEFRAVGSKTVLQSLANDILNGNIKYTCIAMDRDHDCHTGSLIVHPAIFYTQGYSWENDVFRPEVVSKLIEKTTYLSAQTSIDLLVAPYFADFYRDLRSLVRIDVERHQSGQSNLQRTAMADILGTNHGTIDRSKVAALVKRERRTGQNGSGQFHSVQMDCFGHLIALFSRHVIDKLHKTLCGSPSGLKERVINRLAIEHFGTLEKQGKFQQTSNHFQTQFSRLKTGFFPVLRRAR